jgi:hypothetical protein
MMKCVPGAFVDVEQLSADGTTKLGLLLLAIFSR